MAGIDMQAISYKGAGPAVPALLGGEVQVSISSIVNLLQHVKAGSARALAVTSARRSPLAPDIPTVSEKAVPGYVASTWYGMLAPANTPAPIVTLLNETLRKVLDEPAIKTQLLGQGLESLPNSPAEFAQFIREDRDKWAKVVRDSGAKTN
jgi:tripartite-type tricarboxylate transporter receptor subunit TctC